MRTAGPWVNQSVGTKCHILGMGRAHGLLNVAAITGACECGDRGGFSR